MAGYIWLVFRAVRWEWQGREDLDALIESRRPFIAAFWHGRILMIAPLIGQTPLDAKAMISNNRDGEMIARAVARFGSGTIRGSTQDPRKTKRKGGSAAFNEALAHLSNGGLLGITPDGPRGPRMRAQHGVAALAAHSGAPIVPLAYSTRFGWLLGSWDRFLLPLPWGRGAYVAGRLIEPSEAAGDVAALAAIIEHELLEATRSADKATSRATPEPDAARVRTSARR